MVPSLLPCYRPKLLSSVGVRYSGTILRSKKHTCPYLLKWIFFLTYDLSLFWKKHLWKKSGEKKVKQNYATIRLQDFFRYWVVVHIRFFKYRFYFITEYRPLGVKIIEVTPPCGPLWYVQLPIFVVHSEEFFWEQ